MTDKEKLSLACRLSGVVEGSEDADLLSSTYLHAAKRVILSERHPFSEDPDSETWEARFDFLQGEIAADMFLRRGAEGEKSHSENGVSRSWESAGVSKHLLARIVPKAGVLK